MRNSRWILYLTLAVAWCAFALFQYRSFQREQALIRETLHQQAHSVGNALIGGIRSHRRLGRFFEMQLQGMLEQIVQAADVLAAAVIVGDDQLSLSAGQTQLLPAPERIEAGESWEKSGFLLIEQNEILPSPGAFGQGPGFGGPGGRGRGMQREMAADAFADGAEISTVLLLDRQWADSLLRGSARNHGVATIAGGLVLIGLALAWRTTVGLIEERSRSQLLAGEARHFREMSQAAAGLAHETRNPLGLVRGWTERLAQGDVDPAEQPRRARAVIEECDRITSRINQFLAFARPCRPEPAKVNLQELLDELRLILQPDLEAKSHRLILDDHLTQVAVSADRELLRQALFNLLQNAIQFSPPGEAIEVSIARDHSKSWSLAVVDHGPGIAPEHQDSLFTPYFTTRSAGTGLGLAIVRRIAFAHGWHATWQPRPGGGSRFALEGIDGWDRQNDSRGR
jgi:signal transduction histidine kinase